ncbi:MAG: putative capsid protein [Taphiavirus pestrotis]|uniref:Putative capsid protein n=1 Tax=Circoviridae sp. TaxID=1954248 RepID=A0A345MZH2_9VIRU|nr:MAG: putative capsid protein [Circoviridae sp.]
MSYFSPSRISKFVAKVTPSPIKRSFEYYNEAAGNTDYFGNPDPYYFARPGFLANQEAMRPLKRARTMPRRRRKFKRVVRKFKKRARFQKSRGRLAFANPRSSKVDVKYRIMTDTGTIIYPHGVLNQSLGLDGINFGPERNQRDSDSIFIKGIRTEFTVTNQNTDQPLFMNIAWVGVKDVGSFDGATLQLTPLLLLRDYGIQRGQPLDNTRTSLQLTRGELNTDIVAVLKHKRYMLQAVGPTGGNSIQKGSTLIKKFWIPVKREFQFNGTTSNLSRSPMFCIWWFSINNGNAGTVQATAARMQIRNIVAFTDSN